MEFDLWLSRDGVPVVCHDRSGLVCNLFWSDEPEDGAGFIRDGIDVLLTNCAHVMLADGWPPRAAA